MQPVTCTTHGITISVSTRFEASHSDPYHQKYVHSYTITIKNNSTHTVQLLSRHWIIMDCQLNVREVRGKGVIGRQPILRPDESHTYSSWSPIATVLGKMTGSFQMMRTLDNEKFDVRVPVFVLCYSGLYN